jgi:glyoxylase-like metal-dependent hydrolase (beta-lactamase superfamily II)
LWALATKGHSPGHVAYLVNAQAGPVLVTGDAAIDRLGFERGVGCGTLADDRGRSQHSMEVLVSFARRFPQVKVVFGHGT